MKIARLKDGKWTPENLPGRWSKEIPATTLVVDDNHIDIPEKNASIPISTHPELGWEWLQDIGFIDQDDVASGTVAPILGELPICNDFQQINNGALVDGWVVFDVELLPSEQLSAAIDTAADQLLLAAEKWQESHPQGLRGTAMHLLDRLLAWPADQAPKAYATEAWIRSIYAEQADRVVVMQATLVPPSLDFSSCGEKPHTIAELMAEEAGLVAG